jgi:hypothetical protein
VRERSAGTRSPPVVLFEPLVRAAGTDIDRILSVRKQVEEPSSQLPKAEALIPPEFLQLWDVGADSFSVS